MATFETQVGIIGAGPAGLMLSHLLHQHGIASIVLEAKPRNYCEERVRAGVLEHTSVAMLRDAGIAERLEREGLRHEGIELGLNGLIHRIPFVELTGKAVTVYGQQEVVKDLIARRLSDRGDLRFECGEVSLHGFRWDSPFNSPGEARQCRYPLVRLYRRMRRLSWCFKIVFPTGSTHRLRPHLSFCVARNSCRSCTLTRRAGLHVSRAWIRSLQHAIAARNQVVSAMQIG